MWICGGIGFVYRYGYFTQSLSMDGQQIANYEAQNFGSLPLERVKDENDQPMVLDVTLFELLCTCICMESQCRSCTFVSVG